MAYMVSVPKPVTPRTYEIPKALHRMRLAMRLVGEQMAVGFVPSIRQVDHIITGWLKASANAWGRNVGRKTGQGVADGLLHRQSGQLEIEEDA